ncbi:MAG: DoxX protein, partial [Pseudomonadota bacterium]
SLDKIIDPEHAVLVFRVFYFAEIGQQMAIAIGVAQTAFVLAFLIGAFKTWTYGGLLLMHTVSVASTWEKLITPYAGNRQILFWGAVPVVAALLLLFLVRRRDRLLSVG